MEDLAQPTSSVKKLVLTALLIVLIVLTLFVRTTTVEKVFEPLDNISKEYLENTLTKSALTYASVRVIHAAISIAKGSTIEPPFTTVAVGEVLTPVADLLEKFSDLLLIAIASLGAQRIFLELSQANALLIFVPIGSLLIIASLWLNLKWASRWGLRIIAIGLVFRLIIPLMTTGAFMISQGFLANEYQYSMQVLLTEEQNAVEATENRGLVDRAKEWASSVEKKLSELKSRAEQLTKSVITLFSIFVFETIIFPLFSLWIFHRVLTKLF